MQEAKHVHADVEDILNDIAIHTCLRRLFRPNSYVGNTLNCAIQRLKEVAR